MNISLALIPLIPLFTSLFLCVPNNYLKKYSGMIASFSVFLSLLLVVSLSGNEDKIEYTWFTTAGYNLTFSLTLSGLEWLTSLIVSAVGLLVVLYSVKFISVRRLFFFRVISFFIGSMLLLVLSGSFVFTFISWEFVGLSSFLLIGFWYDEENAAKAAQKAFLMTRIGDFGFLLAFLIILVSTGTTDINSFLTHINSNNFLYVTSPLLAVLFLTAALGKSAQLPLTSWLPDAMAGPAPVSALIHSATMVAAGVFLLLKLFPLYEAAPAVMELVMWIGGITALTAALIATTRYDIKRILAWSTISQLGEMYFAIGLGGTLAASFHLSTHAVFKAGLFLTAGIISHSAGSRDIRQLGNLFKKIPVTAAVFIICGLALAGFPLFAGFWSEEEILADAVQHNFFAASFMILMIFIAGVYISRAGYAVFGKYKDAKNPDAEEKEFILLLPMVIFAAAALVTGFILKYNIESLVDFRKSPSAGWSWRSLAVLASLTGLFLGSFRVKKYGPVPTFGNIFVYLKSGIYLLGSAPSTGVVYLASFVNKVENVFDNFAKGLVNNVENISHIIGGKRSTEYLFNYGAEISEKIVLYSANTTDVFETEGFADKLDKFAKQFSKAGSALKKVQTGKIYLYVIVIFSWFILSVITVSLFFLF